MIRLLLDESMPLRCGRLLREAGYDASHLLEREMGGWADEHILSEAIRLDAVVVTFDSDFHQLLAQTGAVGPSVVRLRVARPVLPTLTESIVRVVSDLEVQLRQGAVVSVTSRSIRYRLLPIRTADSEAQGPED